MELLGETVIGKMDEMYVHYMICNLWYKRVREILNEKENNEIFYLFLIGGIMLFVLNIFLLTLSLF